LTDTNVTGITDGELLKYDNATSKYVPTGLTEDSSGTLESSGQLHIHTAGTKPSIGGRLAMFSDTGGGSPQIALLSDTDSNCDILFGDTADATSGRIRYSNSVDAMQFFTNGSEGMRIASDGKVGINTVPQNELDVDGAIRQKFTVGEDETNLWDDISSNASAPMDGELVIQNNATDPDNENFDTPLMAGIFFRAGATTSSSGFNTARIAAVREGAFDTSLAFATRASSGGHTEKMRITSAGNVGIGVSNPSSKLDVNGNIEASGIYLGGTGSANLLSDYEEGTWTPNLISSNTNPTVGYTTRVGSYTKVGQLVHAHMYIKLSSISGTIIGLARISGLPFSADVSSNIRYAAALSYATGFDTNQSPPSGGYLGAATTIYLTRQTGGSGTLLGQHTLAQVSSFQANSEFTLSITYETTA